MPQFELRQSSDKKFWTLNGYASRTGVGYTVNDPGRGRFIETIERGAFTGTLARGADVVLAIEHAPPYVARTPRTLTLTEDDNGLKVNATLDAADPDVQGLVSKVRNGILPEMSFSFRIPSGGDTWDGTKRSVRSVDMDHGDVSVVRSGANPTTSVNIRGGAVLNYEVRSASGITIVERRQQENAAKPRLSRPSLLDLQVKASVARADALEAEARAIASGGPMANRSRQARSLSIAHKRSVQARLAGDTAMAQAWDQVQATEAMAQALGL